MDAAQGITAGPLQFPAPKRLPLGPLMDFGYENEVLFPFSLDVVSSAKPGPVALHAKVDWLVCREVCIPGKAELERRSPFVPAIPVQVARAFTRLGIYERLVGQLPNRFPQPAPPSSSPRPPASASPSPPASARRKRSSFPKTRTFSTIPRRNRSRPREGPDSRPQERREPHRESRAIERRSRAFRRPELRDRRAAGNSRRTALAHRQSFAALARIVGLAFLGGLLLNLMPCVFPVLFLKGLALVNSGNEEKHKLRAHGFVYTAGILVSFWALVALLLGLRAAGATLGWGFQFQSPVFSR
jgi:hypothetical protein